MHLSLGFSRSNTIENNAFKNYIKIQIYRFETHTYDMDIHKSNMNNEEEACSLKMPYTPKIFRPMTLTTTLAL